MSALSFEIFVNDVFIFEATNSDELLLSDDLVEKYLDENPEIDRAKAKVQVKIKREPCRSC